jgi:hyperosmotically inducible periplasmic protein
MLFKNRATQYVLLGVLCGMAPGCNESRPPVTGGNSTNPPSTTVTADRPAPPVEGTTTSDPVDPANTGVNDRDSDGASKTPIDQNENQTDINITAEIRKQVVDTKMSVDAQNVKIITQDGMVTLRGPVTTTDEKQRIDEIAKSVAGADKVDNQLEVTNK